MGSTSAFGHGEEVVVPPPAVIPAVTQVRGTLITASLKTLADRGYADRYWAALPAEHHAPMRAIIASSWVPEALSSTKAGTLGVCGRQIRPIGGKITLVGIHTRSR